MSIQIITTKQIEKRRFWIDEISRLSVNFGVDATKVEQKISAEIKTEGISSLLGHLRLCGAIPEQYDHDSSEEKLYSKYTDVLIHEAYSAMGFQSLVLKERGDVADVECVHDDYSFVADAKAFRLSRTAKNQKNFKLWEEEKLALVESIKISKEESLIFLASERERIMRLSKVEAINEVLKYSKIESKIKAIIAVSDNGLLT